MIEAAQKEYPINTLVDMAKIPRERWAAMMVELPKILTMVAETAGLTVTENVIWVDDEKTNFTVNILPPDAS